MSADISLIPHEPGYLYTTAGTGARANSKINVFDGWEYWEGQTTKAWHVVTCFHPLNFGSWPLDTLFRRKDPDAKKPAKADDVGPKKHPGFIYTVAGALGSRQMGEREAWEVYDAATDTWYYIEATSFDRFKPFTWMRRPDTRPREKRIEAIKGGLTIAAVVFAVIILLGLVLLPVVKSVMQTVFQ